MIDKTQRLNESLDSFLTEYKEKNEGNKYRPVAVGRYGIRTRESIYSKELAKDYSKNKLIFKNTLTVGMGSTQIDIGVLSDDATYAVSPAYHTYRIHDINSDYLRYCLECRNQDMFVRYVKRGSRQGKTIDLKRWITYKIPVYSESVQAEIVKRLDSVKAILSLREQELNALDDLIKARFVEMFGDPVINSRGWSKSLIGDYCFVTKLAGFEYTQYINYDDSGDVVMVKAQNVKNGKLNRKDLSFISNEVSDSLPRSQLAQGDIVMTYVGANIGDVAVIDDKYKYHLAPNVAKIRPNSEIYDSTYFMYMLMLLNAYIVKNSADTAKAALGMERIRKLNVFTPPIELQQQFSAFVAAIDKSKLLSGCRLFHSWAPENRDKPQHVGVPRRKTKDLRGGRRQQ